MSRSPFAKRSTSANIQSDRRQSTRIAHVVPIVISGRDAASHPFRESTETLSVSFHGAALKTRVLILNGMHLTVENLMEGVAEEAICISVTETQPGEDQHAIAIQLLNPRNVWGVKEPPADWKSGAEDVPVRPPEERQPANLDTPQQSAGLSSVVAPNADQRSAEFAESVLQLLRRQAAGMLRETLKEFEGRLRVLESGAEARVIQHFERAIADAESRVSWKAEKSVTDAELSLVKMRRDLLEQLTSRTEKAILSAEAILREKMAEALSPIPELSPDMPAEKSTGPDAKK